MAGINGTITMQSGEYRPCLVYGKKGLFHRWTEKEQFVLENNRAIFKRSDLEKIRDEYEKTQIVPMGFTATKLGGTYAIIEFEEGDISLIDPRHIHFLDSGNMFYERSLFFREEAKK